MADRIGVDAVRLNWKDKNRPVVVTPDDQDRFMTTVQDAVRACRAHENSVRFNDQFQQTINRLGTWVRDHRSEILQAYVSIRDTDLLFLVETRSREYSREFEDALTDLDISIAQDSALNLIRLSVLAIPHSSPEAVNSFLSAGRALVFSHA
ncbi:MAG: hypothetical protein HYY17_12290 [Planctomycetes bacterium]|nr:hypothetical protein [Planctomycetota bacterium]